MEFNQRESLIVFLNTTKKINFLNKFGSIKYISKDMKYAIIYVDANQALKIVKKLKNNQFVKTAYISPRATLRTDYTGEVEEEK